MEKELLEMGICGLHTWKQNFITRTILIALICSCIFCFGVYFSLQAKYSAEQSTMMQETAQKAVAWADSKADSLVKEDEKPLIHIPKK